MFDQTFKNITGFAPYSYQIKVAEAVMSGRNVLLIAPTGSGKTWAAVAPFIHAKLRKGSNNNQLAFADRLIYALPLRTLVNSLHADVVKATKEAFAKENIITSGKDRDFKQHNKLYITVQTGEFQEDPLFKGDIIFTTIDQLLSSYINMPLSLPRKLSNINAGAFIGAQIVLDEFHLLEEGKSLSTTIEMIDRLRDLTNALIMTATLSESSCGQLASVLGAEQIELEDSERLTLPAESKRKREWLFTGLPLGAPAVVSAHKQRSIVLCNTVNRAQELCQHIKEIVPPGVDVILLHSRFYPDDRSKIEAKIVERFGTAAQALNDSIILVTTQVIEAGMDISCDVLHSEIAPVNSLVQRAGRCARYGGDGEVYIYELLDSSNAAPYDLNLVENTRVVLPRELTTIDFKAERQLIDIVHGKTETSFIEGLSIYFQRKQVACAMSGADRGAIQTLIRDIDSVQVVITEDPNSIEFGKHKWPMALSVPRSTLRRLVKDGFRYVWSAEISDDDDDIWSGIIWREVDDPKHISGAWLVALHPDMASYSNEFGLIIGAPGPVPDTKYLDRPPIPLYSYKMETLKDHSRRSIDAFERISTHCSRGLIRLAEQLNIDGADLYRLARLLIGLHDIGKLSIGWQSFAKAWQVKKNPEAVLPEPLAHTDYDPFYDAAAMRNIPNRPPHAAEGAFALGGWLFGDEGLVPGVAVAAMSAVARHHSGHTSSIREFEFIEGFERIIYGIVGDGLTGLRSPSDLVECKQFPDYLINPLSHKDEPFLPLYWYFARLIRLSDQLATKEVNEDENIC